MSYGTNTFDYDAEGKRTKKNSITYSYDVDGRLITESSDIEYFYDTNSAPLAFAYLGEVYYYKKNLLGNVIEILDTNGATMVKYTYDAWGNHTITDYTEFGLGSINPFRYRSYYYDTETGLYYLKSRYYDPQTGRFINIDDISYLDPETIGGANLYTYCLNNPIKYVDPQGHSIILTCVLVGLAIGAIAGGIAGGITAANRGQNIGLGILAGIGVGALFGAVLGLAVGLVTLGIAYMVAGAVYGAVGGIFSGIGIALGGAAVGFMGGNNLVNAVYYTYFAEPIALDEGRKVYGEAASYYVTDDGGYRHVSRWDRLNHVKKMTEESWYNINAWRYYSEYSGHMYVWAITGKFHNKGIPVLSPLASRSKETNILKDAFDQNVETILLTILFGILGI